MVGSFRNLEMRREMDGPQKLVKLAGVALKILGLAIEEELPKYMPSFFSLLR
jgi:hypothetical protein